MGSATPEGAAARLVVVDEFDTTTRIEAPGASGAELQAILAAYRELWPDPVATRPADVPTWRFSGRWWADSRLPRRQSFS
ncbi:MAG: hypothetical protein P6D49_01710 [Acidimicrobiales bacterium]|jgi:hypothetical protein|nr:hypothetical protein [Acidimicrobiales bacterium]